MQEAQISKPVVKNSKARCVFKNVYYCNDTFSLNKRGQIVLCQLGS